MHAYLSSLVHQLDGPVLSASRVIPWSSPILAFGDPARSTVASLGINPSNREFVDTKGIELNAASRRFHTLRSLGLSRWKNAGNAHFDKIVEACNAYFWRNPYDRWFRRLDRVIVGAGVSFYSAIASACHLDLVPYATECKWAELTQSEQKLLLSLNADALGLVLRDSAVRILILNGRMVVDAFQEIAQTRLNVIERQDWILPRATGPVVRGFAYIGMVRQISGVDLRRDLLVLGFNHNIQSSFGVTNAVISSIQRWVQTNAVEHLA